MSSIPTRFIGRLRVKDRERGRPRTTPVLGCAGRAGGGPANRERNVISVPLSHSAAHGIPRQGRAAMSRNTVGAYHSGEIAVQVRAGTREDARRMAGSLGPTLPAWAARMLATQPMAV